VLNLPFQNAGHLLLGRQNPAGINAMAPLMSLDPEAQLLLASAPTGAALLLAGWRIARCPVHRCPSVYGNRGGCGLVPFGETVPLREARARSA
jgi:hypothetical protein